MWRFEEIPRPEKREEEIVMSSGELDKFGNMDVDNPELAEWMREKGIAFDSGRVDVVVDGRKCKMETSKEDFGTIIQEREEESEKEESEEQPEKEL